VAVVDKLSQLLSIRVILTTTKIKNAGLRLIVPEFWHPLFVAIGVTIRLANFARSVAGFNSLRLTFKQLPSVPDHPAEIAIPSMVNALFPVMSAANVEIPKLSQLSLAQDRFNEWLKGVHDMFSSRCSKSILSVEMNSVRLLYLLPGIVCTCSGFGWPLTQAHDLSGD
jgi:hypothetical protein